MGVLRGVVRVMGICLASGLLFFVETIGCFFQRETCVEGGWTYVVAWRDVWLDGRGFLGGFGCAAVCLETERRGFGSGRTGGWFLRKMVVCLARKLCFLGKYVQ